jgi:hypothetical protein
MTIQIPTEKYDRAMLGKPWIARVTFEDPSGVFHWGDYVGAADEPGLLVLSGVGPGDIVARGQKNWSSPKEGAPSFFEVTEKGELAPLATRAEAFLRWNAKAITK